MKASSFYVESVAEIKSQIKAISSGDFKPNLAIIFASVKHDLVGCSSSGEIIDETITAEGISVLALDMNKNYYKIMHQEMKDNNSYENLQLLGTEIGHAFENPAVILFSGGVTLDGVKIVNQIKQSKTTDFPIYGGLAGDDLHYEDTFSFTNNWMTEKGVVALVINNDKVRVRGKCVSGWEGMEGTHQITKSNGNILYEINHKPALNIYKQYLGFHTNFENGQLEDIDYYESILGQYPLIINRSEGYTIMRSAIVGNSENNSIILAGGVNEGEHFQFGMVPDFELFEKTTQAFGNLKEEMPSIDAALIINCKGRQTAFGPEISEEIEAIYKLWEAPSIGFFSYGEIGNVDNGSCEFHNVTCTLATLTEI